MNLVGYDLRKGLDVYSSWICCGNIFNISRSDFYTWAFISSGAYGQYFFASTTSTQGISGKRYTIEWIRLDISDLPERTIIYSLTGIDEIEWIVRFISMNLSFEFIFHNDILVFRVTRSIVGDFYFCCIIPSILVYIAGSGFVSFPIYLPIPIEIPLILTFLGNIGSDNSFCTDYEVDCFSCEYLSFWNSKRNKWHVDIPIVIGDNQWGLILQNIFRIHSSPIVIFEYNSESIFFCNVRDNEGGWCILGNLYILRFWITLSFVVPYVWYDHPICISSTICRYIDQNFLTILLILIYFCRYCSNLWFDIFYLDRALTRVRGSIAHTFHSQFYRKTSEFSEFLRKCRTCFYPIQVLPRISEIITISIDIDRIGSINSRSLRTIDYICPTFTAGTRIIYDSIWCISYFYESKRIIRISYVYLSFYEIGFTSVSILHGKGYRIDTSFFIGMDDTIHLTIDRRRTITQIPFEECSTRSNCLEVHEGSYWCCTRNNIEIDGERWIDNKCPIQSFGFPISINDGKRDRMLSFLIESILSNRAIFLSIIESNWIAINGPPKF